MSVEAFKAGSSESSEDDNGEVISCSKQASKYAEATSIHGLKYIAEPDRHCSEKYAQKSEFFISRKT